MIDAKQQAGLTMISWVVVLAVAGTILLIVMKLVPVYMDHNAIRSGMKSVAAEFPPNASQTVVRQAMQKRLSMNNVTTVHYEQFEVLRDGDAAYLEIVYEAKTSLFGNISLVVDFEESFEMGVAE